MSAYLSAHPDAALVIGTAVAGVVAQALLVVWVSSRLREIAHMRERMSRLADGLALLTDTTEAGLSTMTREIQALARRGAAMGNGGSRATVSRRVVAASRKGARVERIAAHESLSESEVRLHLKLAEAGVANDVARAQKQSGVGA